MAEANLRRVLDENMSEGEFQYLIIDCAHIYGWRVAHFRPARTAKGWRTPVAADGVGFPDLVLVRGKRLLFVEVKSEKGRWSESQQDWARALLNAGGHWRLWRPRHWAEIQDELGEEALEEVGMEIWM